MLSIRVICSFPLFPVRGSFSFSVEPWQEQVWPFYGSTPIRRKCSWEDVGALALGGALGTIAVIVRQEIVLFVMGGIFVAETVSVMLQVTYFKYTKRKYGVGRRIFLMAPLHHHFEQKGWKETKVVVRFWIITMILVLIGLSTLKIR